jgi:phosphate transport system substrate-binding protein
MRSMALFAVAGFALLAGTVTPLPGQNLIGAGATFPYPLYSKWFDVYNRTTGVRVNYQSIGSGGGIRQYIQGTVDFGATDSPMNADQLKAVDGNVTHLPTVVGAVVLTYNLPSLGATPLRLDAQTVTDIFLGKITRWDHPRIAALNPGVRLPRLDVIVVHRSDGSGTTFVFVEYLSRVSAEWKQRVGASTSVRWPTGIGGRGNEGVTAQVKQLTGAIGYVELVYALSNRLRVARVRNAAGTWVDPNLASVTAAAAGLQLGPDTDFRVSLSNSPGTDAWPIASYTWLLIRTDNPDQAKARAIRDFLTWILTPEAQRIAAELGYAPLPDNVAGLVGDRLRTLRASGRPIA